ncbi:hypothetical protein [Labrenzia sp. CE80]|uniref:hypothetical protein n=1 Tax=Labrenzia sp. CE80 TaxID=1788986 RepID=UPI001878BC3A|nr:hypothetical protein [Labrenzia sp. CE80]
MNDLDFGLDRGQLRRAWGVLDRYFQDHKLTLRRGSDFEEIEHHAEAAGLPLLEGHWTPTLNTYTPSQAFWLGLFDDKGALVGRVCARFDRMEYPMTLADFWRKYFSRCYPNVAGGQVRLALEQPRVGRRVSGRVVYIGGTVVSDSWRGAKLGARLNQMAQIEAMDEWRATYFYGWVQGFNFKDGFWRDCGFTRAHFDALRWSGPLPKTLDRNLIHVANTADDLCDLIDRIVAEDREVSSDKTDVEVLHVSEMAG